MKRNSLRKAAALALTGALTLGLLAGCTQKPTETTPPSGEAGIYTPGNYKSSAKGYGGQVTVNLTVDANHITAVTIDGPDETPAIGGEAIKSLPDAIKAADSAEFDAVSGATLTSDAVKEAVADCLSQAKGEAAAVADLAFTPGTYTGVAKGYGGDLEVEATFTANAITELKLVSSKETDHVGTPAIEILFQDIKDYTSTGVDVVSGATFTSNGVLAAVEDAAAKAGCDAKALRVGAKPYELTPKDKITDTYDIVVVGAGGAGMAAAARAAQEGATVLVIEKEVEPGGNTIVAGCSYQSVMDCLAWDAADPDATQSVYVVTGETVEKVKSDEGRLATLRTIVDWKETPFDGTVADPATIKTVDDYDLPNRGVHAEYLDTLLTLKDQIRAYLKWADAKMAAGAKETDLTLFSTVELHIFQTYYGGLRLNADKTQWIYGDFALVEQMCSQIPDVKAWMIEMGAEFDNTVAATLIGCLWQRINRFNGGTVNGEKVEGKWGTYFAVPMDVILSANAKNQIMTRTTAKELITDASGKVTGVKAVQYDGTEVEVSANYGVILTTGGYGANIQMVLDTNDYWAADDVTSSIKTTNRSMAQGEGIVMAQAVGAGVVGMEFTQLMPIGWADNGTLAGGNGETVIFISPAGTPNEGKRYVDESAERDVLAQGAYDFGGEGGLFIQLMNAGKKTAADNVEGREYFCTLAEASEQLDIPVETLRATITEYDDAVRNGTMNQLAAKKTTATALIGNYNDDGTLNEDGLISVRYLAPSTHHTMGGLTVDTAHHVLTADGKVIDGLFAAGEVTGGIFAGNRLGGNAISEILVSGKTAAETALASK